jgi:ABC-2 type transport system ATP-binding protein
VAVIEVRELTKRYGEREVLAGISFEVGAGEVFGIVGPNGAGKTTTVESVTGLRRPDGGEVRVLGLDPRRDATRLKEKVGVQLQQSELPQNITVGEALELYASFYPDPADHQELLTRWGLAEHRKTRFCKLSGGLKQRLFLALALVGKPAVAVLDELTTGLDPKMRRATWRLVEAVRGAGVTVLLVSHYMDEVARLCDRVAVLSAGRIVALDTPAALVAAAGGSTLDDAYLELTGEDDEVLT